MRKFTTIWDRMTESEKSIRRSIRTGMTDKKDGSLLTIKFISGFEEFNHPEGWDQGWIVEGYGLHDKFIQAKRELLQDAINDWIAQYEAQ